MLWVWTFTSCLYNIGMKSMYVGVLQQACHFIDSISMYSTLAGSYVMIITPGVHQNIHPLCVACMRQEKV